MSTSPQKLNREKLYDSIIDYLTNYDDRHNTNLLEEFHERYNNDYQTWGESNFNTFDQVTELWKLIKLKNLEPHNQYDYVGFLKNYACDLDTFKSHRLCTDEPEPTPPQNTETPNTGETPETPSPDAPETPNTPDTPETTTPPPTSTTPYTPPPSDKSKDSPNESPDPEGNGTEYNIPGDPYQWRVGKDGGWWAKRSDQSVWYNISGRAQKDMPNWGVSVKRMDDYSFEGNAEKRAKSGTSEPVAESFISLKLGKFFLD